MNPSLYKINFPSAQDFFLPEFLEKINIQDRREKSVNWFLPASQCINSKFHKIKNLDWSEVLVIAHKLYIEPTKSYMHTDHPKEDPQRTASKIGFNWILNHHGRMSFWSYDNVKEQYASKEGFLSLTLSRYESLSPPDQTYEMKEDSVYMINGGIPHQITSFKDRICISARCYGLDRYSWDEVVEMFADEIVPVPTIEPKSE